ncbi:MAG TPA: choice-of-anchor J domain-containing protein [Flavobacteriaceae bacterium]|nr:choice-of-anchor J domain-containing protein [Flavobacteriaceae bacterium]
MKKIILFSFIMGIAYSVKAQCESTLPVYQDFSNTLAVNNCWTFIDADGDGLGWYVTTMDSSGNKGLKSSSFAGTPLTPDNWAISEAIDLPPSGSDELTWKVRATYWQYDAENYAVYVATGNQMSDFTNSSVSFTENLAGSDASGVWANRSLNISSLAGQTVYVAFRHFDVTDQYEINVDDFAISSTALGIEDFNKENFTYYYSPNSETLTLKSSNKPISSVVIYNLLGQKVVDKTLSNTKEDINLSTVVDGIYIAQVEIDNTTKAIKFLKQ